MAYPANYKYTKEHEWISVEGTAGTVGITDYAQSSLGDIVFVDLPKVGATISKGATFGSVESVKAVSDIYAPVTGEVTEANETLGANPEKLNADPHGAAWLIRVRVSSPEEFQQLMPASEYQTYVGAES